MHKLGTISKDTLLRVLRERIEQHGSGAEAARRLRISPQYLHDICKGTREPGPKVARALGFTQETRYRKMTT